MTRNIAYLAFAGVAIALLVLVVRRSGPSRPEPEPLPLPGVYRIASASVGGQPAPELVGRAYLLRSDGTRLIAALCPDDGACARWLGDGEGFRLQAPALPPDAELDDVGPARVLAAAAPVDVPGAKTITSADGNCRRRRSATTLERLADGVRVHREVAQTGSTRHCEQAEFARSITIDLDLERVPTR